MDSLKESSDLSYANLQYIQKTIDTNRKVTIYNQGVLN